MSINTAVLLRAVIWLVVAAAALVLAEIWFDFLSGAVFWKIFATLGIVGVAISVVLAVRQDLGEEKKMKDDKFLN